MRKKKKKSATRTTQKIKSRTECIQGLEEARAEIGKQRDKLKDLMSDAENLFASCEYALDSLDSAINTLSCWA